MPLVCIFNENGTEVVTYEERDKLVATGRWFKHPNDVHAKKDIQDEKPIRRKPKQRNCDSQRSSKQNGRNA